MYRFPLLFLALFMIGCNPPESQEEEAPVHEEEPPAVKPTPQNAWWAAMQTHCGNAYEGRLAHAPPGDDMLEGDELLIVHFRECSADEMQLPFHIERMDGTWDRSRTWIYTRTGNTISLRHDHRTEDGNPDEGNTDYGGSTQDDGLENEQRFIFTERVGPQDETLGWRVIINPNEEYIYGTFRGDEWSWRVEFDLTQPVDPPPPAWGY